MNIGKSIKLAALAIVLGASFALAASAQAKVQLTLGSWRADDVAQMTKLLDAFTQTHPNISIKFDPTNPPDYNAALRLQLQSGIGPDLMYARSYDTGEQLFKDGFFADVTGLPGLKAVYSDLARAPWADQNGKSFAVPFCAVSHGVYYNVDIFKKLGLSVPKTWEDFLAACKTIQAAGITPVANGLADQWDINEVVMMNILPNYIGGAEGRLAYESGKAKFNDAKMVSAFQAMKELAAFCPKGFEALTYNDSNALFVNQKAAMLFDGSWTMASFTDMKFDWSVFPPPPPKGHKGYVTFHPGLGHRDEPGDQVSRRMQDLPPVALLGPGRLRRLQHDPDRLLPDSLQRRQDHRRPRRRLPPDDQGETHRRPLRLAQAHERQALRLQSPPGRHDRRHDREGDPAAGGRRSPERPRAVVRSGPIA